MNSDPNSASAQGAQITSLGVLGARLTWVLLGPVAIAGIAWGILSSGSGWLTALDAAFAVVIGLMLLGRWIEHRSGTATTLTGQPATVAHFRRYVVILVPAAAAVWAVANLVGNHVLR